MAVNGESRAGGDRPPVGGTPGQTRYCWPFAADTAGNLYASDPANDRILKRSERGDWTVIATYGRSTQPRNPSRNGESTRSFDAAVSGRGVPRIVAVVLASGPHNNGSPCAAHSARGGPFTLGHQPRVEADDA